MYSASIEKALRVALEAHAGQSRKCSLGTPYAAHPVHMAIVLARHGADDAVVQAALLHDVVEDCEDWTAERMRAEFGPRVAGIVAELSEDKSQSWETRKEQGIAKIARLSADAALVKAMDQLHNIESLCAELRTAPDAGEVWRQFRGGRDGTVRVAERMVSALEARLSPKLGRELRAALDELIRLARIPAGDPG